MRDGFLLDFKEVEEHNEWSPGGAPGRPKIYKTIK